MRIKAALVGALTFAVLIVPGVSRAQTSAAELQAQIAALVAQMKALQAQLDAQNSSSAPWCHTFSRNISIGMSGSEVTALQTALQKDGESVTITGSFDDQTAAAVTSFQQKYAGVILTPNGLSNGTGYAGAATRSKLNSLFGCGGPIQPAANPYITGLDSTGIITPGARVVVNGYGFDLGSYIQIDGNLTIQPVVYSATSLVFILSPGVGVGSHTLAVGEKASSNMSNSVRLVVNPVTPSTPSIHITGVDGARSSDSSLVVNLGDTFTISGMPQNLAGLSYYFGSGFPPAGYYTRAYFFDQNFSNNNTCGNNEASVDGVWTLTCTARVQGSSAFYVEIYANGQTYRSNTVYVTIQGPSPVADPVIYSFSVNASQQFSLAAANYSTITFQAQCGNFVHVLRSRDGSSLSYPNGNLSLCNAPQYYSKSLTNSGPNTAPINNEPLYLYNSQGLVDGQTSLILNPVTTNVNGYATLIVNVCNTAGRCVQQSASFPIYAKG